MRASSFGSVSASSRISRPRRSRAASTPAISGWSAPARRLSHAPAVRAACWARPSRSRSSSISSSLARRAAESSAELAVSASPRPCWKRYHDSANVLGHESRRLPSTSTAKLPAVLSASRSPAVARLTPRRRAANASATARSRGVKWRCSSLA